MTHLHRIGVEREGDLLLNARARLGRLSQQESLSVPVPLDGVVVGAVGTDGMFRRVPEPMSAVDAPSVCRFRRRRLRPEQILAARPPEVQDSDAELQGDEQLVGVVGKAQAVAPFWVMHFVQSPHAITQTVEPAVADDAPKQVARTRRVGYAR
jgi:hypothetical protein